MDTKTRCLEGVVLGGDLLLEELADEGDLEDDVVAHAGHLGEEPEGEEAGNATEASGETTTARLVSMTPCRCG